MKNILLLYPKVPDNFWTMKQLIKLMGKKSTYPPLGLLTVASLLPKEWKVDLIDLNIAELRESELEKYDFVFISAMNVQSVSVREVIRKCKDNSKTIVAGGTLFTHQYDEFPEVDHFVLNEAEITLPEFLTDLQNNNLKRIYQTDKFANVKETPIPDWKLINMHEYAYAIVQYSRGCPYLCDFCDVTALFGREPRVKTSKQIISELDEILRNGKPEMILFADDNLIGNKVALKKDLLPALIDWRSKNKFAPGFATQVTVNIADDNNLIELMLDAGFRHLFIGIETPDEKSLFESRKKQNLKRNLIDNISFLQNKGFIITGGFIVGFDSEDESIFTKQERLIEETGIIIATINVLKAPPGTELHKRMKQENRLIESFDFNENETNILLKMDKKVFRNGYRNLLENVYSSKNVFNRVKRLIGSDYKTNVKYPIRKKISLDDFLTFFRSVWVVGISSKQRKFFWKLLAYTLSTKPKRIMNAFLFSILIYQFNDLREQFLDGNKFQKKI